MVIKDINKISEGLKNKMTKKEMTKKEIKEHLKKLQQYGKQYQQMISFARDDIEEWLRDIERNKTGIELYKKLLKIKEKEND